MFKEKIPLEQINRQGIYNRGFFVLGEKSPYTQGLEQELKFLEKLTYPQIEGTL